MDDTVTIICYGSRRLMTRKDAIKEFSTAAFCCEGSERDRYCSIVCGLNEGKMLVDDLWEWSNALGNLV